MREYIVSTFSHPGEAPEELLDAATEKAQLDVIGAKQAVGYVEKDLEKMSRERLFLDEKAVGKVAHYEANLSCQLHATIYELEVLQLRPASEPYAIATGFTHELPPRRLPRES